MSNTKIIREALDGFPVSVAARSYGPGSPFPQLRNNTAIEINVGDGELGSHTIDLELDDAVKVAETILALVKSVRTVENAAGAYLGGVVMVGSKCRCGADADTVIHSDLFGEWDVCEPCGLREIARMRVQAGDHVRVEHIQPTAQFRRQLLELYLDQGIAGVRDHIDEVCPGCIVDLIVGYVVADSDRLIAAEFGSA